ncbi:hypothetical protein BDV96DRAFT_24296 [Lophiotrema nucula]|uniref:Uncharacterized protein n=1 Tax=Lophiotrema nucula TaxID=690887 RepID=A0A6A5ZDQ5_9PLEO|nr:hypothetical protein BDV96DRAFT_24296 [Lophiotrema nucula]
MSSEHLTSIQESSEELPRREHNPDETYARYERSPFRNFSLKPNQGNQDSIPTRQSSLMDRINSVRARFSDQRKSGRGRTASKKKSSGDRPEPDYSLAGRRPNEDEEYESCDSDEGFGDYGRRPQPTIGLAKPFPRQKRGGRFKKNANKSKQPRKVNEGSRAEPGSESGKPEGQVRMSKRSPSILI